MKDLKNSPAPSPDATAPSAFAVLAQLKRAPGTDRTALAGEPTERVAKPPRDRGRLDILRNTAHRGGKTVTVIKGFSGIDPVAIAALARQIQKACGAGGTVKAGAIEIQGDHREQVMHLLRAAGFRPVLAGG